nr:hypothetical protein [Methylobacterium sp. Leaf122]
MRYREILEAVPEAGIIKPEKPLPPAHAQREAERKAGVQKRIRDQQATSARKIADLRAKLAD